MEFCILGPLEARAESGAASLGAAKQRALLAILLLHPNEVVSRDRLIDELWGASQPATAANAIQVYVAQVRKALEPGRQRNSPSSVLLTRPGGYQLRVEPGALDAERFEDLLVEGSSARAAGDPSTASTLLREALDLWRGPALADFTYEPFAQTEIARLDELRLSALEERLEADLALGNHATVVGELEALVRDHPLRERLRAQLMLALYRTGRQAEALEAYQDARRTLTEELGIVPGSQLQRLEGAILRQEDALDLPAEAEAESPPPSETPKPAPQRRKTVTVLVAARRPAAGLDPEALEPLDERYLARARRAIERHGGSVEGGFGDRMLAVFGIPLVHEDDALRAARAAVELPGGQAGIATGEVVTSQTESGTRRLVGEPLARARQLAESAPPGEVLLAEETRALLSDAARTEPAETADGPAWRLRKLAPQSPPLSGTPDVGIVGRASELSQLKAAFDRTARDGAVHLFTVLGAAGIGKTRLAEEFASQIAESAMVLAGRCVPYGEGITFWPLREMVGQLTANARLSQLVRGRGDADLIARRITEAVGQADAASTLEEIFWALRELFESLARERALVLVFEDVHWAEPTLLDFIEYVADRVRGVPLLLLCLARPELLEARPGWSGGKRNASSLFLEPLSEDESEQLIGALAAGLADATRTRVQETAEGNPLFLQQTVAMLAEQASVEGEVPIPPTIEAVLAARLDRLGPGERAVIERAAVVGKDFQEEAVAELVASDARPFTSRHLEALVGKELVDPVRARDNGRESFRFRHVLIQQSSYRAIPKRVRAELHERVAVWLEAKLGSKSPEYAELGGYHLEKTYRYRAELRSVGDADRDLAQRAAELLASEGRRAFGRGDMPASANLLQRAVSLLPADDRGRLQLLNDLGYALFEIGELERANAVLSEAIDRGRRGGDRAIEWTATVKLAHARMYTNPEEQDTDGLMRLATNAIEVLEELGDDLGMARALCLMSDAHWPRGEMTAAGDAAREAAEWARRAASRREEAWGLGALAFSLLHGPTPAEEAGRMTEQLVREAEGDLVLEANLAGFLAAQEAMTGRFDDARRHVAESCERLRDLGLRWQVGIQEMLAGYVELFAGDPVAAEVHMRRARESFVAIGDRWSLSTVSVDLPRPVYEQGRYDDAFSLVAEIDAVCCPADREWQMKRRGIHARLLARQGQIEDAERLARDAVAIASETDQLWFYADVLMDLAEVLRIAARFQEGADAAGQALQLYERKGILPAATRARALVAELEAAPQPGHSACY